MARLHRFNGKLCVSGLMLSNADAMYLAESSANYIDVDIKPIDKRHISDEQRKMIFALCTDISNYTGDDVEWTRLLLQQYNANVRGIEVESLSSCSVSYANGLIDTIINYCIDRQIPVTRKNLDNYNFDARQTYSLALNRTCVVCGQRADLHHVDRVGMGRNRQMISHKGLEALPLCRNHHIVCHQVGDDKFIAKYHLSPFKIDDKMEYFIKKGKILWLQENDSTG